MESSQDDTLITEDATNPPAFSNLRLETAESMEDEYVVPITPRDRRASEDNQDKPGSMRPNNRILQNLSKSFVQ